MTISASAAALAAVSASASSALPASSFSPPSDYAPARAEAIFRAAEAILPALQSGSRVDASCLRADMSGAFGGTDAQGYWSWKDAYDACEIAQLLFLRKFGTAMHRRAGTPAEMCAMLDKLAALLPTHTKRSAQSQAFQQLSTPIPLAFVAAHAAGLSPGDLVLEPSAGTGLLAIHAELAGAAIALNELADTRAALLGLAFPDASVTGHDAAHIDDHLGGDFRGAPGDGHLEIADHGVSAGFPVADDDRVLGGSGYLRAVDRVTACEILILRALIGWRETLRNCDIPIVLKALVFRALLSSVLNRQSPELLRVLGSLQR